jgi:Metallo-beta-lactamase superfamily
VYFAGGHGFTLRAAPGLALVIVAAWIGRGSSRSKAVPPITASNRVLLDLRWLVRAVLMVRGDQFDDPRQFWTTGTIDARSARRCRSARDLAPGPTMDDGIDSADQAGMISFDRSFDGGLGELVQLSPLVRRMVAGNAGPMTFTGTCTYVVGTGEVAVIDPGPDRPDHIAALLAALRGETVTTILVSHTHTDHSPGARALKAATGARIVGCAAYHFPRQTIGNAVYAADDFDYAPDVILHDGDAIEGKNFSLVGVETPGHAMNH